MTRPFVPFLRREPEEQPSFMTEQEPVVFSDDRFSQFGFYLFSFSISGPVAGPAVRLR